MPDHVARPADNYSPLYFLASLGAGGITVTFFMFLMFWVPHPGQPVPVFGDIATAFANGGLAMQTAIVAALSGIGAFAFLNLKSLVWNLRAFAAFRQTEDYGRLRATNAETTLLAMPLALAMSINVGFILGLVFVPGLWTVVEYLFPAAMVAFLLVGVLAFRQIGDFLGRVLSEGGVFDVTANNSFAQLLPAFALSMVGVGFAAPAAMSGTTLTVGTSLVLSTFFGVTAALYAAIAAIIAFNSMLQHGTAKEAGPTLMVVVPIMTVLGILFLRQEHGLHTAFGAEENPGETLVFLARLLTVQIVFFALGLAVLLRQGYFADFVIGPRTSPGSYALVCPAVALSVMGQFFINKGLVGAGVVTQFSAGYWALTAVALVAQVVAIALVLRLNRQHFTPAARAAVPAE
ncbi:hypothetical protein [Rhodosalinus sp. K401]|uniref:TsoY family (seleno)protein n=1 Tax=Rhodosalinus sp. K401 TaxID=3239195 RepID=UPI00352371DA